MCFLCDNLGAQTIIFEYKPRHLMARVRYMVLLQPKNVILRILTNFLSEVRFVSPGQLPGDYKRTGTFIPESRVPFNSAIK